MKVVKADWKDYLQQNNKFDYVIADPPWKFGDKPPKLDDQLNYSLWDKNDSCLEYLFNSSKAKHYFIWIPTSLISEFMGVVNRHDELVYKTMLTWVKLTATGKIHYGLGHTLRNATEQLIFLTAKGEKPLRIHERNIYHAKTRPKTGKPRELEYKIVESLQQRGFDKGVYLFSGTEQLDSFKKFNIDLVDIGDK